MVRLLTQRKAGGGKGDLQRGGGKKEAGKKGFKAIKPKTELKPRRTLPWKGNRLNEKEIKNVFNTNLKKKTRKGWGHDRGSS